MGDLKRLNSDVNGNDAWKGEDLPNGKVAAARDEVVKSRSFPAGIFGEGGCGRCGIYDCAAARFGRDGIYSTQRQSKHRVYWSWSARTACDVGFLETAGRAGRGGLRCDD